jgi:hypothetical protein
MSGEKALPRRFPKRFGGSLYDIQLGAADIGYERARRERWTKALDVIENRQHRRGQHHEITAANRIGGVDSAAVNGAPIARSFKHWGAIAPDNTSRETTFLQRQAK